MADSARSQLSSLSESLQEIEAVVTRQNISLDDFRKVVKHASNQDLTAENAPAEFQRTLGNLESSMAELDQKVSEAPSVISSLGLTTFLSSVPATVALPEVEGVRESRTLYDELVNVYATNERNREYCLAAANALNQLIFRKMSRKAEQRGMQMPENIHKQTETYLRQLGPLLPALSFTTYFFPAMGTVVEIVVDRMFRVAMVLRGTIVEGINVRGSEESFNLEPRNLRPVDLWTPSVFEVYRLITQNATAAIMHFHHATMPEQALRSYLQWVNSLASLFSTPCKRCGKFLDQGLPPTWRDYKKLEPFHESCRLIAFTPI